MGAKKIGLKPGAGDTEKRTNEIGTIIPLLKTLPDIEGRTITADALLTQTARTPRNHRPRRPIPSPRPSGQGGAGVQTVQSARNREGPRRMASGVLGAEHQAHEGAGGVLSEPLLPPT